MDLESAEQRVESVRLAAERLPGAGIDWRIIRRADAFYLQTRSLIGGSHWSPAQQGYATLTDALEIAVSLFSEDVQAWPVVQ